MRNVMGAKANRIKVNEAKVSRRLANVLYVVVTIILVLIAALSVTGTVMSKMNFDREEMESYYTQQEKNLVKETRAYLNENGFQDSGVTLTRVVDGEGMREYTLTVHHSKIDKMSSEERMELATKLDALSFEDENCTFCQEFLITEMH